MADVLFGSQVTFLEAVDQMFGQIVKRLWYNHQATHDEYSVVCTGDHSTPVVFGDHSHEPVPFVIADVIQVVRVTTQALAFLRKQGNNVCISCV